MRKDLSRRITLDEIPNLVGTSHSGAPLTVTRAERDQFEALTLVTLAHTEPQRGDAGGVHLVGDDTHAAEDHFVKGVRRERLPHQQRPTALHGEIDRLMPASDGRTLRRGLRALA